MKRRRVLLGAGAMASMGLAGRFLRSPKRRLSITIWLTAEASAYPRARDRAAGYLRSSFGDAGFDVELSHGESVQRFDATDRAIERREWPKRVLKGATGLSDLRPAADVNLLLTDGRVGGRTVGYAFDHIATVPGARFLAESRPAETAPTVQAHAVPAAIAQLLLHEVGHALGLDHEHGSISVGESAIRVSPMVSGYAWSDEATRDAQLGDPRCGGRFPNLESGADDAADPNEPNDSDPHRRELSMAYAPCAVSALRSYRGGFGT